ncbi:hypothetical protein D3C73_1164270 [compost metagenome]
MFNISQKSALALMNPVQAVHIHQIADILPARIGDFVEHQVDMHRKIVQIITGSFQAADSSLLFQSAIYTKVRRFFLFIT